MVISCITKVILVGFDENHPYIMSARLATPPPVSVSGVCRLVSVYWTPNWHAANSKYLK